MWCTCQRLSPQFVPRWSPTPALSPESQARFSGASAMIVRGWFEQRMSWFPIPRLQVELEVCCGRVVPEGEATDVARLVYATLERVAPQFPSI